MKLTVIDDAPAEALDLPRHRAGVTLKLVEHPVLGPFHRNLPRHRAGVTLKQLVAVWPLAELFIFPGIVPGSR